MMHGPKNIIFQNIIDELSSWTVRVTSYFSLKV